MKKSVVIFYVLSCAAAVLTAQSLALTAPNGGERWPLGSTQIITWTCSGVSGNVRISLVDAVGRPAGTIATVAVSDGRYRWTVGELAGGTAPAGEYRVTLYLRSADIDERSDRVFSILESGMLQARPVERTVQAMPRPATHTFTMPVSFRSTEKHRERHQWNCLFTMGIASAPDTPNEFMVGFHGRCADGGPGCADQCYAQAFRGTPLFEAARLRTLVGKNVVRATLSFRHKSTDATPTCATCLARAYFYSGRMGEANPPVSATQPISPVPITAYARVDVTDMITNWLREEDPAYHGEQHNYQVFFVGPNEELEFSNQKCYSIFDDGSLEVQYRD